MKYRSLYVTNAFSLSMIKDFPCTIKVQEVPSPKEAESLIISEEAGGAYISFRIGHASTLQVLREMLKNLRLPEEPNRDPVTVEPNCNDAVLVFQLFKRPQEGQIYSQEELKEIISKNLYKFLLVEV
ncbi:DUF1874 domain-containing protein [Hydrogenivirga sp. 128-5-R1-1]|uniref:STIV orfB116 family protein n=1 Tax=Hydrogenivirga sp. 128-5-R1-1 TaxID=392423 RepID=UPI00015F183A|nr:DUF1874 domain-containing protein [Hydrogenivirga sp. 128-5-R1-1]EDP75390.1 hypothetical protein HG1285_15536 [Hydrogenivirga sp. 128-5-R1-1]